MGPFTFGWSPADIQHLAQCREKRFSLQTEIRSVAIARALPAIGAKTRLVAKLREMAASEDLTSNKEKASRLYKIWMAEVRKAVSASLQLTSLEPLKIVYATVDWNCATTISSSMVSAEGGASSWEQLSMLISGAFGAQRGQVVPALRAGSWGVAHVYLCFSNKKISQTARIAMPQKDWHAEFWFPGSLRSTESIEIPVEYRHFDIGDLFVRLMRNHLSFKLFV